MSREVSTQFYCVLSCWCCESCRIWAKSMMTSSNGNIFRVTGHLCGEFIGPRWNPRTKASDAELWFFFFDLCLNKRLSKQSWGWWFETLSRPLWRHRNATGTNPQRSTNHVHISWDVLRHDKAHAWTSCLPVNATQHHFYCYDHTRHVFLSWT